MRPKKNLRRVSVVVTAQTAYNLDRLCTMYGCRDRGNVIDRLVREKMVALRFYRGAKKCSDQAMKRLDLGIGKERTNNGNE